MGRPAASRGSEDRVECSRRMVTLRTFPPLGRHDPVLAYHALCLATPLAFHCSFRQAGLVWSGVRRWLPAAIALSVLLIAAGVLGTQLLTTTASLPPGWEELLARIEPWCAFAMYSVCVNPLLEEYFWRGFLLPKTRIVPGAALFWLMHISSASVFLAMLDAVCLTLPALGAGLLWGWMRQRLQNLWSCVITHMAADSAVLWMASTLRS